jgi:predicted ATPase
MQGKRLIHSIRLRNFLSYGEKSEAIELLPLNVLIGTNASGKSNLLEAIALLRSLPKDFQGAIREGGGASEWIWKGGGGKGPAKIDVTMNCEEKGTSLSYSIVFQHQTYNQEAYIKKEKLSKKASNGNAITCFQREDDKLASGLSRGINSNYSALALLGGSPRDPEATFLGAEFQKIGLYRDWNIGRHMITREPQSIQLPGDFLSENMSNLALILNNLLGSGTEKTLRDKFGLFYEGIERIQTKVDRGKVNISLYEKGLSQPVPATRLSDGMLHYLCLLALLLHPEPPPLIAIEEPEIGMHPDMIRVIAELLIEASQRTQIIVTTHSDLLVSSLDENPECVLVCERTESGSQLQRLEKKKMAAWLKKYSVGELWLMGELGGVRK